MSGTSLAPALGLLALAIACTSGCERPREPAQRVPAQRIVLVTIDTLRADFVGAYTGGNAETPNLDALAESGVRFTAAISPAPLTLPSHASILTGLDPPHHGVRDNMTFALPDDLATLPEALAEGWHRFEGDDCLAQLLNTFVDTELLDSHLRVGIEARGFDVTLDDGRVVQAAVTPSLRVATPAAGTSPVNEDASR